VTTELPSTQLVPLDGLREHERARVIDVDARPDVRHRLEEMGLREGTVIRLLKRGTPCILCIGDQRLCYRPEPDTFILVEPLRGC